MGTTILFLGLGVGSFLYANREREVAEQPTIDPEILRRYSGHPALSPEMQAAADRLLKPLRRLIVSSPVDGTEVTTATVEVVGRLEVGGAPEEMVVVAGRTARTGAGDFRIDVPLVVGENQLYVELKSGRNSSSKLITVTRADSK